MRRIETNEIHFSPTIRLLDPNGRVFFHKGEVYRGIYEHRVRFVRWLFDEGVVDSLVRARLLVGTYLTDLELQGFGLVLRHDAIDVNIRASEWSVITYIEAARQYLRLTKELVKHNLVLIDGHHSNFSLGLDGVPIWHDFGSIVENPRGSFFCGGLAEWMEYHYWPLMYFRETKSFPLLRRLGLQLSHDEYVRMHCSRWCGSGGMFHPSLFKLLHLIELSPVVLRKLPGSGFLGRAVGFFLRRVEVILFGTLYSRIDRTKYRPERTEWSDYHRSPSPGDLDRVKNARAEAISSLISQIRPGRTLDLGANQGIFSHLAYRHCPVVIASDYDHAAVAKHAKFLLDSRANKRIYPVMLDVTTMSDDAKNRYRSDLVLALALTHHLRLGQKYPFDFIAKQFSSLSERSLITEFMPNGLGIGRVHPDPLPDDYTLESLLSALRSYFGDVSVVDYQKDPSVSPRILILCRK